MRGGVLSGASTRPMSANTFFARDAARNSRWVLSSNTSVAAIESASGDSFATFAMLGACALIDGAALMCCTADVSSVGASESSVVSLLVDESVAGAGALFETICGALSPAATVADLSAVLEHADAASVSKSDTQVSPPCARVFARSRKNILERRKTDGPVALHIRCQTGYPQARPHLACQPGDLIARDVAAIVNNAFYQ